MTHLIEIFYWSWSSDGDKPKNVSKKLTEKHKHNFLNFSENAKRNVTRKSKVCIFLKIFNTKWSATPLHMANYNIGTNHTSTPLLLTNSCALKCET